MKRNKNMAEFGKILVIYLIGLTLAACSTIQQPQEELLTTHVVEDATLVPTFAPTATPTPPRVLTICTGQEPTSLFLYADSSAAARGVRQAIYDGPFDFSQGEYSPVILERMPTIANGDALLRAVQIVAGQRIIDADGGWVSLQQGVRYRPSGCTSTDCAQTYDDDGSITMDQLVVGYKMLPGLTWSDGAALTAQDSVYSYEVASALFGSSSDLLRYTASYTAIDEVSVEWIGIPGYQGSYAANFFSPLPEHVWGLFTPTALLSSEAVNRAPLGWGPYILDQWVAGDHISLHKNPNYFRSAQGLPNFDNLVYRFVATESDAIDALMVGECDLIDQTVLTTDAVPRLQEAQNADQLVLHLEPSSTLEQAVFSIDSLNINRADIFDTSLVRQAIATCIDRQAIVDQLLFGVTALPDGYLPAGHPLHNPDLPQYSFDPQAAIELLNLAGWVDYDLNPETARTSVNVVGVPNDTSLSFTYLVPDDAERPAAAKIVQDSLARCGIGVEIEVQPWYDLFASGPDGPLFGRNFDVAQFAWSQSDAPPCYLYLSDEIPGPYPAYDKGWGGGNLSGYSNPAFDQACRGARSTLPDTESYLQAHLGAQAILAEDLPSIPLYWRLTLSAARADICAVSWTQDLRFLETMNYGIDCDDILP
ncbi:MAG: hypothetical protein IMY76_00815 [Chloroflexi bacterium]|nr:hypothetical protein [Chloroflexota bacterium]